MNNPDRKDISTRNDVYTLVSQFYSKVRKEETLGPIFNNTIDDWDAHIERLTDFWETNLLFVAKFKGNPIKAHIEVDQAHNQSITNTHFGIWLRLWITTMDELYEGPLATLAVNRARKMGSMLFMKIFQSRNPQMI